MPIGDTLARGSRFDINLLSPIGHQQYKNYLDKILMGGTIEIFLSGTNDLAKVFKDKEGVSVWLNPIVLDSLGHTNLLIWLPVGKLYDFVYKDREGNFVIRYDRIDGIGDLSKGGLELSGQGIQWNPTSQILDQAANTVTIKGDWTEEITPFKRLELKSHGLFYGWATNITLSGADTIVEYELDQQANIGQVGTVQYGLISSVNTSKPIELGGSVYYIKGRDITATDIVLLWDTSGNYHIVSGTDPISDFGITIKAQPGAIKWLLFKDGGTINATGKISIPGGVPQLQLYPGDVVQVILDDVDGTSIAFPIISSRVNFTIQQPSEKRQTVLTGDTDASGNPFLIKTPILSSIIPPMTSNTLPLGYQASVSTALDANSEAFKAFDGLSGTLWSTIINMVIPAWIMIKMPVAKKVRAYSITRRSDADISYLRAWRLQGSTDGVSFKTLDSRVDQIYWPLGYTATYYLTFNPDPYNYYRILVDQIGGANQTYTQIAEIKLYEFANDSEFITTDIEAFSPVFGTETSNSDVVLEYPRNMVSNPTEFPVSANRSISMPPFNSPVMTAPNAPTGYVASASTEFSGYPPWKAFNKSIVTNDWWITADLQTSGWVKLELPTASIINLYTIQHNTETNPDSARNWTFEGSNDNSNWTILDTRTNQTFPRPSAKAFSFINFTPYKWYRFNCSLANTDGATPNTFWGMNELWLYNDITPVMFSDTSPTNYVASGSSQYDASYPAWKAFNKTNIDVYDCWITTPGATTGWLKIQLPLAMRANQYSVTFRNEAGYPGYGPKDFTLEGSNDNSAWTILDTRTNQINWGQSEKRIYFFSNNNAYLYYRINVTANNGGSIVVIAELTLTWGQEPYLAFDQADSTGWFPGFPFIAGDWLKVDFKVPDFISYYRIKSEEKVDAIVNGGYPKTFTIEGSNDDVAWTVVDARYNITWSGTLQEQTFYLPVDSAKFRYFRLVINETSNGKPPYIVNLTYYKKSFVSSLNKILPVSGYAAFDSVSRIDAPRSLVPILTGITNPSGFEVKSSGDYNAGSPSWRAFDGDFSYPNSWYSSASQLPCWLQIKSPNKIRVKSFLLMNYYAGDSDPNFKPKDFQLQASDDGINFTTIHTVSAYDWVTFAGPRIFTLPTLSDPYFYFRLYITSYSASTSIILNEWQLFDFDVWSVVPNMTSNVLPAGYVASASTINSAPYDAWQAFKDQYLGYFQSAVQVAPWYLQIKVPTPITLLFYTLHNYTADTNYAPVNWTLQGSNNGTIWDVIQTYNQPSWAIYNHKVFQVNNQLIPYSYFRLNVTTLSGSTSLLLKMWRLFAYEPTPFAKTTFPEVAFDNKAETFYSNTTSTFVGVKLYDFSSIYKYSITPSDGSNLKSWVLQGSSDGVNYFTIDIRTGITNWTNGVPKEFIVNDRTSVWKYYKWTWSEVTGTYPQAKISEIKLYRNVNYKAYYQSTKTSLHTYANGFTPNGPSNVLANGPGKTFLKTYESYTHISSTLLDTGVVSVEGKYRPKWMIIDDTFFTLDYKKLDADWPILWNGANFLFTQSTLIEQMLGPNDPTTLLVTSNNEQVGSEAWRVFDYDARYDWFTNVGTDSGIIYITFNNSTPTLRQYTIATPATVYAKSPSSWYLSGSNDNVGWFVLDFQNNITGWSYPEKRTYPILKNIIPYKYYKIDFVSSNPAIEDFMGVGEIQFYTVANAVTPVTILDQYGNQGTISGSVQVVNDFFYDTNSVIKLNLGSVKFIRDSGFYNIKFTVEVKWSPLDNNAVNSIFGIITSQTSGPSGYSFYIQYDKGYFRLYLSSNGTTWDLAAGTNPVLYNVKQGEWYHVRLTFDGTVYVLMVNGTVLIKHETTTRLAKTNSIDLGFPVDNLTKGYFFDLRYLPHVEPPDTSYLVPFYPALRFDPFKNLASYALDRNISRSDTRWVPVKSFMLGEVFVDPTGIPTALTYTYGGVKDFNYLDIQQTTGNPDFFKVSHNLGVTGIKWSLDTYPEATTTLLNLYTLVPIKALGMNSGAATWNGQPLGMIYDKNYIGIKWPQNDSADFASIYAGSGVIQTVSGSFLKIHGVISRNF